MSYLDGIVTTMTTPAAPAGREASGPAARVSPLTVLLVLVLVAAAFSLARE